MEFQNLGKSGLKVSKVILGAMSFGNKAWGEWVMDSEEQVFKLLKYAYDNGIRTWDTANVYSHGDSERLIGKFLKQYNINRSTVTILSKCYAPVNDDPGLEFNDFNKINRRGLSRKHIFDAVDASVQRLGTYIDVLQIHRLDKETPYEEIMKALNDVVESGKVRYIGASSMKAIEFAQLQFVAEKNRWTKFISMQNFYNLIYREEEREMIPFCNETGVGIIPWSPIAMGLLTRPLGSADTTRGSGLTWLKELIEPESSQTIVKRIEEIANKKGVSMAQIGIAWTLSKGTLPIVGFSSEKRIDDAIAALKVEFTDEELKYLEEPYTAQKVRGH